MTLVARLALAAAATIATVAILAGTYVQAMSLALPAHFA
ncbi:hypothetical protein SAMN05192568_1015100 [Methylobacterium pseudosasicola]|uniref:Uncharacterized protein n=1 Tax=Methylobacterium pseudosasicola TaxID=582667 RepID=A0A1I4M4V1_9HYPH|nr:hypothetical protein SAMN05192568_1015100 [Methylobacterium pseudosasicola]